LDCQFPRNGGLKGGLRNGKDCMVGIVRIEPMAKVGLRLWPTISTTEKSRPFLSRACNIRDAGSTKSPGNCALKGAFL